MREEMRVPLGHGDKFVEPTEQAGRAALGTDFDEESEAGRRLTPDNAVELALASVD